MSILYVDADACPVKDEVVRVAVRHDLKTYFVSDGGVRPRPEPQIEIVIVSQGTDAADDWIAERATAGDVVVTNDIPLAARCIDNGAAAIRPNGEPFSEAGIGMTLASRNLMTDLRETGAITGGPRPFSQKDRSRFLDQLETLVRRAVAS